MAELTRIKQISLSDGAHEIDAKYWDGHSWGDVKNVEFFVCTAANNTPKGVTFTPKGGSAAITGTLEASAAETNKFYLVYSPNLTATGTVDNYDEYVAVGGEWERIRGTGEIDLDNYAKKGSITLAGTAANAGAATITSSSAGAQTASGSATITYKKADATTGNAGAGENATTDAAGGATISGGNFTFTGTTATLSGGVEGASVGNHSYCPEGTIDTLTIAAHSHTVNLAKATVTYATGSVSSVSTADAHSHEIDSHTHGTAVSAATITGFDGGAAASWTGATYTAPTLSYSAAGKSSALTAATVSGTGVLSFSTGDFNTDGSKVTAFNAGSVDFGNFNGGSAATLTYGSVSAAGAVSAVTLTSKTAGSHSHTVTLATSTFNNVTGATLDTAGAKTWTPTFSGTTTTLEHTVTGGSVSINYQPAGAISGSQTISAHSHSYVAPVAHTHTIGLTDTTVTGTASVAVSSHTHSVEIGNHSHTVSVSGNNYNG